MQNIIRNFFQSLKNKETNPIFNQRHIVFAYKKMSDIYETNSKYIFRAGKDSRNNSSRLESSGENKCPVIGSIIWLIHFTLLVPTNSSWVSCSVSSKIPLSSQNNCNLIGISWWLRVPPKSFQKNPNHNFGHRYSILPGLMRRVKVEHGTNYRGPAVSKGAQGLTMFHILLF